MDTSFTHCLFHLLWCDTNVPWQFYLHKTNGANEELVSDGELRETQMTNYFSNLYPIDCAVLSVNAQFYRKYGTLPAHEFLPEI